MPRKSNWWLNRAGEFARYSNPNPESAVPAYGVTFDVATAPWQPEEFNALLEDQQNTWNQMYLDAVQDAASGSGWGDMMVGLLQSTGRVSVSEDQVKQAVQAGVEQAEAEAQEGNWFTDTVGAVADAASWAEDQAESLVSKVPGGDAAWDAVHSQYNPLLMPMRAGLAVSRKFDEGVATVLTGAAIAEDRGGNQWANLFKKDTWTDAHAYVKANHINMGEAVTASTMSFGQDNNLLTDEERFNRYRQKSGWFNLAGVASSIALSWRADPLVLAGKGVGAAQAFRRGDITGDAAAQNLQRDIIGSSSRAEAEAKVLGQTNLTDRLYAKRGLALFDRLEKVREASQKMELDDFLKTKALRRNTNGLVMGALIKEANDDEWGMLKRYLLGDRSAIDELSNARGEIKSKIDNLNTFHIPRLEKDIAALEKKANDLELEDWYLQLGDPEKRWTKDRVLTGPDDWLDDPLEDAKSRLEDAKLELSTYQSHDDWFNRVLAGVGDETGTMVSSGGQANVVFGGLESIGSAKKGIGTKLMEKATRPDMDRGKAWRGESPDEIIRRQNFLNENPSVFTWQHDWLSPKSVLYKVPRSWFLKTNHLVNFHETDKSLKAISGWMDTLETVTGRMDKRRRSEILEAYAKAMTEDDRKAIVEAVQAEGIRMVGQKYGLNDDMLKLLAARIADKHSQGWQRLVTQNLTTHRADDGSEHTLLEWWQKPDATVRVQMPMSTAELPNFQRLVNLQDVDYAIRRHKDVLREMSESMDWKVRLHGKAIATRRMAADIATSVGEMFNAVWKPLALISLRWPLRVIGDENTRWSLLGATGMAREAFNGTLNLMHNTLLVKPWDLYRNTKRGVKKVASLSEDAIMPPIFDGADVKMRGNPAGHMPLDVAELDLADESRYLQLGQQFKAWDDTYRRRVVTRAQGGDVPLERWEQQFNDRVNEVAKDRRGFVVDPLSGKAQTKGWVTSVYPGRMRTLGGKPNSDDYRLFSQQNQDVLQNKRNQVGVWYDDDLDVWVMDIVRVHGKRDDALREAAAAGVDHVFDANSGFKRIIWDDDPLGNWGDDMGRVKVGPLEIDTDTRKAVKRRVGTGKIKLRTLDGKRVEFTHIYGPDPLNGNITVEGIKSINAVEQYFASGTRMGEQIRGAGMLGDFKTIEPAQRRWAEVVADYGNRFVRKDAVWRRMLQGQSDKQILGWLKSSEGRLYRERMGIGAVRDPDAFVQEKRVLLEQHFPGLEIKGKLAETNITAEDVRQLIRPQDRRPIHGASLSSMTPGRNYAFEMANKAVRKMYELLGSRLSDRVTRHPMGAAMYRMKLENLVARYPAEKLTNRVMKGLEAQARAFATRQIKRYLFDMSDEYNGVRAFRFVAPFFNAQVEVIERYLRLIGEHPDAVGKLLGVVRSTEGDHGPFMQTVSSFEDGMQPTDEWRQDGFVVTQMPDWMLKKFGLSGVYKELPIPTASVNLILQGENPLMPGWGPMVTIPASEWIKRTKGPEVYAEGWFKKLFPYGMPKDVLDAVIPAWSRRVRTLLDKSGDPAYGTEVAQAYMTLYTDWELNGRKGPEPTQRDAEEMVDNLYMLRAVSGFVSPVPINPNGKYQFYIDQYREMMEQDPETADERFYEKYGAELYRFTTSTSKLNMDLPPTELAAQMYSQHRDLMEKAPLLAAVIAGPGARSDEFDYDIYRWQLSQPVAPGASTTIREKLSPEEAIQQSNINRGWIEYNKLMAKIDVELQRYGLVTEDAVKAKAAEEYGVLTPETLAAARDTLLDSALQSNHPVALQLAAAKRREIQVIAQRNPGWEQAYYSRDAELAEWLRQAETIVEHPELENRPDIQALDEYLRMRQVFTTELMRRQQSGMPGSLTADANVDLAQGWYTFTRSLVNRNPLFAEIYHRYLETDDLTYGR